VVLSVFFSSLSSAQNAPLAVRVDVQLVSLDLEVLDPADRPLTSLKKEDFVLLEDGELREITHFASVESPYSIVALVDCTGSTRDNWPLMLRALGSFIGGLRPQDRIAIAAFGSEARILLDWTSSSQSMLGREVQMQEEVCASTDFYGAVDWALRKAVEGVGRRGVIIFSDGVHNSIPSRTVKVAGVSLPRFVDSVDDTGFQFLLNRARTSGTAVYLVAVNTDLNPGTLDVALAPSVEYTPLEVFLRGFDATYRSLLSFANELRMTFLSRGEAISDRRKPAGYDQDLSESDAVVCINVQNLNSGGSALRFTHKDGPHPAEVALPLLFARMKQGHGFALQSS
jgi:hypothetical protein